MTYILNKKKPAIPGVTYSELTKEALQQIVTLLNKNEVLETVKKNSTHVSLHTSEGKGTQQTHIIPNDKIIIKHHIKRSPLQKQITSTNKQNNLQNKSKTITDAEFDRLLQEHLREVQTMSKYTF